MGPADRFCSACGRALDVAAGRGAPDDELRPVTVLFADLSGSVARAYDLAADAAAEQVNEVLTAMSEAVTAQGGMIDRFLGDGVLAIFGASAAREDDAERAVAAALDILDRVRQLGADATVGVNTGEAYVGRMGSAVHQETTAMGTTVNLAARLQSAAGAGEALVGESTWVQARSAFDFEERAVSVKGIGTPVRVFAVRARLARSRRGRRAGDAPLIARTEEVTALARACAEVAAGSGHVVSVIGEPGVGKSRLVAELRRVAEAAALPCLEGACYEATPVAFAPFLDALRAFVGTPDHQGVAAALAGLPVDRREVSHVVGLLSMDEATLRDLPPERLHHELLIAMRNVFVELAARRPVVLVLEDLHWADTPTLALAGLLVDATARAPLLLALVHRPEQEHESWRLRTLVAQTCADRSTELVLRGLSAPDTDRLIDELAAQRSGPPIDDSLRGHIRERTQGNPFFVEELLRSIVEKPGEREPVPGTVQAVIRSRIDRLSRREREVLQLAAVIGPVFPLAILARIDGGPDLDAVVASLERKEFVYQYRLLPDAEYAFRHVLVQETAYRGLLRKRRAEVHAAVGSALEVVHVEHLEDHYEALAHHFSASDDDVRAATYLQLAGERAYRLHRHEAAVELFASVIERASRLPDAAGRQLAAYERTADVLAVGGRHDDARRALKSALALTDPEDAVTAARLHRKAAHGWELQRQYVEARAAFEEAVAALHAATTRDDRWWFEWIQARVERMQTHYWEGTIDGIARLADELDEPITRHGTRRQRGDYLKGLMMHRFRSTRYVMDDDVRRWSDQVLALVEDDPDLGHRAFCRFNRGFIHLWSRDIPSAEARLQEALGMAERAGDVVVQSRCLTYLTVAARFAGDVGSVEERAVRALAVAASGEMVEYEAAAEANLAWAALRRGDRAAATRRAGTALELWQPLALVYAFQWQARFPLVVMLLDEGDSSGALDQASAMLDPIQQRLRNDVWLVLEAAVSGAETERLRQALPEARQLGYI